MAIVFLVAFLNLALGFAAALYMGRGPRNWSDVDRAIRFESTALRQRFARKKK